MRKTLLGVISSPPHLLGSFGHALVDNTLHLLCFPAWFGKGGCSFTFPVLSHDKNASRFMIPQKVAAEGLGFPFCIASVARVRL
jgi:hypothetical protein